MVAATIAAPEDAAVRAAVAALGAGEMVLVTEYSRPAGEGFLVAAAQTVTPETIATMLRIARGMPWLAMPAHRADALDLQPLGPRPLQGSRDFLVSIEAREGTTTGVSAADRALTMRVAANPASTAGDLTLPGHVNPIRVPADGVLARPGAVEAAADLAAAAGLPGGAAVCQVLDDTGEPAAGASVARFAEKHGLLVVGALDVLDSRLREQRLVKRTADGGTVVTEAGEFRRIEYTDIFGSVHQALLHGTPETAAPVELAVRSARPLFDALDEGRGGSRAEMVEELKRVAAGNAGVFLYMGAETARAVPTDAVDAARASLLQAKRTAHVTRQILSDVGVSAVRVVTER